jgi:hypothetical protein
MKYYSDKAVYEISEKDGGGEIEIPMDLSGWDQENILTAAVAGIYLRASQHTSAATSGADPKTRVKIQQEMVDYLLANQTLDKEKAERAARVYVDETYIAVLIAAGGTEAEARANFAEKVTEAGFRTKAEVMSRVQQMRDANPRFDEAYRRQEESTGTDFSDLTG